MRQRMIPLVLLANVVWLGCGQRCDIPAGSSNVSTESNRMTAQDVTSDRNYRLAFTSEESGIEYYVRENDEKPPFGGLPREGESMFVGGGIRFYYVAIRDGGIVDVGPADDLGALVIIMLSDKGGLLTSESDSRLGSR